MNPRTLRPWLTAMTAPVEGGTSPAPVGENPDGAKPEGDDDLGDAGKKALAAERASARGEKKRADELAARLKAIEDSQLSEHEKLTKRAAEQEAKATAAEMRAMRLEAALAAGLTVDDIGRLVGNTPEDLLADAKSFAARLGAGAGTKPTPKPDPSQGSRPAGKAAEVQAQVASQLARLAPELKST